MGTTEHKVDECETLGTIANDGGVTVNQILVANPGLEATLSSNYDVLQTNRTILVPDPVAGFVPAGADNDHCFVLPRKKKDLVITLQKADGTPVDNVRSIIIRLRTRGEPLLPQSDGNGQWRFQDFPDYESDATLHITLSYAKAITYAEPPIWLRVGGMDPLTGTDEERGRAVQKMLANLAYYSGRIDGDLTSEKSRASLRKFQTLHGLNLTDGLDESTARKLVKAVGNRLKEDTISAPANDPDDPNVPLAIGPEADSRQNFWHFTKDYVEPTDSDQLHTMPLGELRSFPRTVYVAPCDEGASLNLNVIRMQPHRFVFLDSGRWLKEHRNFSVIWGRHVYLCEYLPQGGGNALPLPFGARKGLDKDFFAGMKGMVETQVGAYSISEVPAAFRSPHATEKGFVNVVQRASAQWAPESEFDWDHLIVVIPDTHLMNDVNGKVFRDEFKLKPELDLLHFVECLSGIQVLQGKLHVIHIGDWFDLWVGRPRLWKENDKLKMEIVEKPSDQKWSCGKPNCKGHKPKTGEVCPGSWHCGRVVPPCFGHVSQGDPPCDTTTVRYRHEDIPIAETAPTYWSCGRAWPQCPGKHGGPDETCTDERPNPGMFWTCGRLEPPCIGHPSRPESLSKSCPDNVNGIEEVRSWIRQIQGIEGTWVKRLLGQGGMDLRGETMDSLDSKLNVGASWVNPAEKAFWMLQDFATVDYLYGNHDNYMINDEVADGHGARKRVVEVEGLYLEHGHRLEGMLDWATKKLPANQDGAVSGYDAMMDVYRNRERVIEQKRRKLPPAAVPGSFDWAGKIDAAFYVDNPIPGLEVMQGLEDVADKGAKRDQQPQYQGEFAKIWLGRFSWKDPGKRAPHVFVIGHTHCPMLAYNDIFWT